MDAEKIVLLVFAIVFSIFSLYIKSKKQKRTQSETGESDNNSYQPADEIMRSEIDEIFEQISGTKMSQNSHIIAKKNKKKQKQQNFETIGFKPKTSDNILQDADIESGNGLLDDFEGTEIQRAFLYSEIFKNTKN